VSVAIWRSEWLLERGITGCLRGGNAARATWPTRQVPSTYKGMKKGEVRLAELNKSDGTALPAPREITGSL
jgi:hypothetical protein